MAKAVSYVKAQCGNTHLSQHGLLYVVLWSSPGYCGGEHPVLVIPQGAGVHRSSTERRNPAGAGE